MQINSPWEYLRIDAPILSGNLGGTTTVQGLSDGIEEDISIGWKIFDLQGLILRLRENISGLTGERIWGFKFTFYPNGKFNVEFNYNKPEGYEETDETISGDQINTSLNQIHTKDG
ncbi:hypothetical protein [Herbaspirillum sp. SJZ099]|uniref:hypothetical protein n=1 Tax=Herbaspirillum sp. SJZ099 TaxID=2572916 RepID=UPI0011A4AB00|nr:hypothetical protein [Herbaspirillum sp. SJZ099]